MSDKHYYGYLKDKPDRRDFLFTKVHAPAKPLPLPPKIDLRAKMPPVWNQGELGSCSSHATLAAFTFEHGGGPWSRLEHYYEERLIEGTVDQDSGAQLRDGIKVLADVGVGLEADWPYDISKFTDAPDKQVLSESTANKIFTYSRLFNRNDFRLCLADGYPFVMGVQVFESFEGNQAASVGVVPMPDPNSEQCVGGHALCVVGYTINGPGGDVYIVRNSWGSDWGDGGYCYIPAAYIENPDLANDFWTIRK